MTLTQSLSDVLNYGLFQPAFNGRAGKFLDEERLLKEYPLPPITPIPYLEVKEPTEGPERVPAFCFSLEPKEAWILLQTQIHHHLIHEKKP